MNSEQWLHGHKLIETGDGVKQYVTVAFAFRCACCGDHGGRLFASMGDDGGLTPQWPFSHEECPLCALRELLHYDRASKWEALRKELASIYLTHHERIEK